MKFINETGEKIKYRKGSLKRGYTWHTVDCGGVADVPFLEGQALGFTVVDKRNNDEAEKDVETEKKRTIEEPKHLKEYFDLLVAIKGVGPKSAEDIVAKYPSLEALKKAVISGEEIHNYDNIDEAVKEWLS